MTADSEKLDEIWKGDLLGRRQDAEFLTDALPKFAAAYNKWADRGAYVLNVDADWGQGKSYFMTRFTEHLRASGYPAVYIDAWTDDHSTDPFTSVMAEIADYVQGQISKKGKGAAVKGALKGAVSNFGKYSAIIAKGVVKTQIRKVAGEALAEIQEDYSVKDGDVFDTLTDEVASATLLASDKLIDKFARTKIDDFQKAKSSQGDFKKSLGELVKALEKEKGLNSPMFILIDELDRCRPTYALEVLERIKHLFDVPNVVFVLSTHTSQLSSSVKAIYGETFDGEKYLQRFFSRTYRLRTDDPAPFIFELWNKLGVDETHFIKSDILPNKYEYPYQLFDRAGLSLRDTERAMDAFATISQIWSANSPKLDPIILLAAIVGHQLGWDIIRVNKDRKSFFDLVEINNWRAQSVIGDLTFSYRSHFDARFKYINTPLDSWFNESEHTSRGLDYVRARQDRFMDQLLREEHMTLSATSDRTQPSFTGKYPDLIARAGQLSSLIN